MGGLRRRMPVTHRGVLVGVLAIAGFPPLGLLLEGRDPEASLRLAPAGSRVRSTRSGRLPPALTAFYMWRLFFLVFTGELRADKDLAIVCTSPRRW